MEKISSNFPAGFRSRYQLGLTRGARGSWRYRVQSVLARASVSRFRFRRPTTSHSCEFFSVLRPIMQSFRIEIGAVGPSQCADGRVEYDSIEKLQVLECTKHLALQDRPEVDPLLTPIRKPHSQRIRSDDLELFDAMNRVLHISCSRQRNGSILNGGWPDCKRSQSR